MFKKLFIYLAVFNLSCGTLDFHCIVMWDLLAVGSPCGALTVVVEHRLSRCGLQA